ncbi:MAG TPA: type I-C CRISPR-associated protein Cas8c/Csd1 [Solidesulfovibrio sp.]|nr:type I-C CRISPR-associated protein Cas8c/Csd1 [Desulfovibrio sp.]HML59368.1 type I-C CRISPR-associated protein Cas8c/Csd1 [Solidesulfovibrio sp.]
MQKLFETYEACSLESDYTSPPQAEDGGKEAPALMPVSHTSQQAHICVTLNSEGNFQRAELLPPKTQYVIPATEDSAGRTSGDAPHPLCDKIHYCAKDYVGGKKNLYALYSAQLQAWCESPQAHPKAQAVYCYVSKGTLVHDLLDCGILRADASGILLTAPAQEDKEAGKDSIFKRLKAKEINGESMYDQGEALVVWNVVEPDAIESRTWKDDSLQQAWMAYDVAQMQLRDLCMMQGVKSLIAQKHPRNIRCPGDGAKLISSNDAANFTYRGRFEKPEQACTVGYQTSHKIHNALRWLIARQGYLNGKQAVVAWAVSGARVPNPCEDFLLDINDEDLMRDDAPASSEAVAASAQPKTPPPNMGLVFAQRLRKAMAGYKADLKDVDGIAIMALDAIGKGRLSVTFYREQMLEQYLGNLEKWQKDFSWLLPVPTKGKKRTVGKPWPRLKAFAPTPDAIGRVAFGRCKDTGLLSVDKKERMGIVERLLPFIVDGSPIPYDIVEVCFRRALKNENLKSEERVFVISVACAVYKGFNARCRPKKEYDMSLDETIRSRDYLYGRLLALAEYIERRALEISDESRPTNAERLMQRFADHPCSTWLQIRRDIMPYIQKFHGKKTIKLLRHVQRKIDEVHDLFLPQDFTSSTKLSGEFLLGYHCQMSALYTKSEKDASPEENTQEGV